MDLILAQSYRGKWMTFTRKHFRHVCAAALGGLALSVVAPGVAADAATSAASAGAYVSRPAVQRGGPFG